MDTFEKSNAKEGVGVPHIEETPFSISLDTGGEPATDGQKRAVELFNKNNFHPFNMSSCNKKDFVEIANMLMTMFKSQIVSIAEKDKQIKSSCSEGFKEYMETEMGKEMELKDEKIKELRDTIEEQKKENDELKNNGLKLTERSANERRKILKDLRDTNQELKKENDRLEKQLQKVRSQLSAGTVEIHVEDMVKKIGALEAELQEYKTGKKTACPYENMSEEELKKVYEEDTGLSYEKLLEKVEKQKENSKKM
tara:strand:+ start:2837 stop:3595 length:759 start_codon:yes stop_codon:yes gene_type:complete